MKKVTILLTIMTAVSLTVAFADSVKVPPGYSALNSYWTLGVYDANLKAIQTDIDLKIKTGFMPVSLEINPGLSCYIAYVAVSEKVRPKVRVDEFTTKTLSQGLNELMAIDFNPQDVCFRGERIFVLSIEDKIGKTPIAGNITQSASNIKALEADISAQIQKGYLPLGISYDNGKIWTFLQADVRSPFTTAAVEVYNNNGQDLFAGVEKKIVEGYRLAGLTNAIVDKKDNKILALFLK